MAASGINVTSCGSVIATMGDTMAVIDLFLGHNSRAYSAADPRDIQARQDKGREKERGRGRTNVTLTYAVWKGGRWWRVLEVEGCRVDKVEATQERRVGWLHVAEMTALTVMILVKATVVAGRRSGRGEATVQLQVVKIVFAGTECS
jgi:hypothetical protein